MLQEIITYMIIGAALALAISKAVRKLRGKKKRVRKTNFQKETYSVQHNCSDCSAECMLRNATNIMNDKNKDICEKTEIR